MEKIEQNLEQIQRDALKDGNWEKLREYYLPDKINFILIGEAPPNGGDRFFYYDDVPEYDNLFLGVISALFPDEALKYRCCRTPYLKRTLLERFKNMGGYLMDLYPMPKDRKPSGCGPAYFEKDFLRRFAELGERLLDEDGNFHFPQVITVHNSSKKLLDLFRSDLEAVLK